MNDIQHFQVFRLSDEGRLTALRTERIVWNIQGAGQSPNQPSTNGENMPEGGIQFVLPDGLTKEVIDGELDKVYDNPVASRLLEAARAQLSNPQEGSFSLHITW